jgi:hypothetical protein
MAGNPVPGRVFSMYNLMDLTINILPLQGQWEVTDNYFGSTYTYGVNLYESFGDIDGLWDGVPVPYFDYINPSSSVPSDPVVIGSNVYVRNASLMSGYELKFSEVNQIDGKSYDYWYQITDLTSFADGIMYGQWRMKESGTNEWSIPLPFSAVRTDWEFVVPYGMVNGYDAYLTGGYVSSVMATKYPMDFLIDTGATNVFIDTRYMSYLVPQSYVNDNGEVRDYVEDFCQIVTATTAGGATVDITCCPNITIELSDKIKVDNMTVCFMDNQIPGLLGMDFLDHFNVRIRSSDNAMVITP